MKSLSLFCILLFSTVFFACDEELGGPSYADPNPDDVEIRIDNQSNYVLKSPSLNTGSNQRDYQDIDPWEKSNYKNFQYAYPTFSLKFKVGSKQFEYNDSLSSNYDKVEAGQYNALIYEIDTVFKTFTFRLEES